MINIFTGCHLFSLGEKGRPFSAEKLRARAPRLSGKGPAPRWLCQKLPGAVRRDPPAPATVVEKEKNVVLGFRGETYM